MRLLEATVSGVVAAIVSVIVVARYDVPVDRLTAAAVAFLLAFLAVMMRADRLLGIGGRS